MDRNAYAPPAPDGGSTEPNSTAESHVRPLPGTLPEPDAHIQEQHSTFDDAPGVSEDRAAQLSPGTCVAGKYIICDVLGMGGSAVVYAAEQVSLKRVVAFKLYPARGAMAAALLQRFEREAQLLARVHHENVVAVFDAGRMSDGSPYLVVQRLHGESLAARLRAAAPLPVAEAVDVARQVLEALCALSDAGVTHRDVKPENMVFDRLPDGRSVLKLVDFGIAKGAYDEASRELDEMVGTPGYMAPEQVRGERIDARSDLYALGATLYEMLTGRTPHIGDTVQEVAMATLFGAIPPLTSLRADCPAGLAQIVMKALAREPSGRFASAREMKRALDRWRAASEPLANLPAREPLEDTPRAPSARRRRARGSLGTRAVAAAACLGALGGLALSQALEVQAPSAQAPRRVSALALHASELAPLELALHQVSALATRTGVWAAGLWSEARASVVVARTGAAASELWLDARGSAVELLELLDTSAPDRAGMVDRTTARD